ncbi:hypothetical protein NLI96_g6476 [Meripilus lineatus]|uniref:Uncharacterized protein n=1 Tax=Meripilus lineatus TaxID=2056292 RepID=A0AAD5V0Y3_9APHY|nr:hypothetical protein NLI96_g6476 [Physisporinus lineatus]
MSRSKIPSPRPCFPDFSDPDFSDLDISDLDIGDLDTSDPDTSDLDTSDEEPQMAEHKRIVDAYIEELLADPMPSTKYLMKFLNDFHSQPGDNFANPGDCRIPVQEARYFFQSFPKGSLPFEVEYQMPTHNVHFRDPRYKDHNGQFPAVPVCHSRPDLAQMPAPQSYWSMCEANHRMIILWWPGYEREIHVEIPVPDPVRQNTNEYLWHHLRQAISQWYTYTRMTIPCKDPKFKLEDRVKLDRIAVSGLEHISLCYYQVRWYTSATHAAEFDPPYFANLDDEDEDDD